MIIDDEVGLKERSEDTRYILILHRNETLSTESVGTLNKIDLIPNYMPVLGTADLGICRYVPMRKRVYI